jgi:hypothetical protein
MNRKELKTALKPLIKECIKEVIFEEGVLSSVIKEVVSGTSAQVVTESSQSTPARTQTQRIRAGRPDPAAALAERKKKLMDSIGADAFNGINIFEGTSLPVKGRSVEGKHIPDVLGDDPSDAGVDISNLFASSGHSWDILSKGNKK